ncbi:gastrula zinc finger protein XlCGF49.1-like isoform X2 [Limulus polyphemus]|uniref:Gastrula zinc finger protein XlCGF49.1-like isoform X2 n=1 Tax=Limulus polyphemus TaxID=6850 RepID=A0ABM1RXF8_LIMPO|nr:gastrula zinc finger protein XlCGF49.1-like isoform X2 [Limulus polyphemus]
MVFYCRCKICEKSFAQSGILQTHMAMHLDQKDFLCEHCGKSFRQKSQLRIHMLRHDGVRNYLCLSCPARFLTKGDLERHNRVHTGERPYVCTLCGKTMTRQQHLNEHMNRHYGLRPYECNYCGKKFAEMSGCYKHIKTHERTQAQQDKMNEEQTEFVSLHNQNESQSHPLRLEGVVVSQADFGPPDVTVFVHSGDQPLELGSEMTVVEQESKDGSSAVIPSSNDDSITTALAEHITDFAAINLLANASSFQQTF